MRLSKLPKKRLLTSLIGGLAAAGAIAVSAAHSGGGIPANRELAWLSHLAETGNTGAQLQLGLAYREGRYGVTPDAQTSLRWLSAVSGRSREEAHRQLKALDFFRAVR